MSRWARWVMRNRAVLEVVLVALGVLVLLLAFGCRPQVVVDVPSSEIPRCGQHVMMSYWCSDWKRLAHGDPYDGAPCYICFNSDTFPRDKDQIPGCLDYETGHYCVDKAGCDDDRCVRRWPMSAPDGGVR